MIEEWPILVWMAFGWAPSAMARATLVCLRSWNRHDRPAARSALEKWCCQKLDEINGLPTVFPNTSPSGPGATNRSMCSLRRSAVTGDTVIERNEAGVFGSYLSHCPPPSRTSCSVTRTLRRPRSTRARLRPTSSLHRMPESTAR